MKRFVFSGLMVTLLLISMQVFMFNIRLVKSTWTGTVCIRADGSIDPPDAPITTYDNITYTLTDNIIPGSIIIERENIVLNGLGFAVEGSTIFNNGIVLLSNNVTVKNVNIKNIYNGIWVGYLYSKNSIVGNNITNTFIAIELYFSSYNVISCNNISNNSLGIHILGSYYNTVGGNKIVDNGVGISLEMSSHNVVCNNIIMNNENGISIYGISNRLYHNNFINNNQQVWGAESNFWDDGYPSGGNYWSDYIGEDIFSGPYQHEPSSSGDGIWDRPYMGERGIIDFYPLVNPCPLMPDFVIIAFPNQLIISQGASNTSTIMVTSINGFNGTVNLDVSGLSQKANAVVNPQQVTTVPDGLVISYLTISIDITAISEIYPLTVTGISDNIIHNVEIDLKITESSPSSTIYIHYDGTIEPSTAPITTYDNITYTLTDNIRSGASPGIEVEKDNIIIDGAGYTVQGESSATGIMLWYRFNVTVKNIIIKNCGIGIGIYDSSSINISENIITECVGMGIDLLRSSENCIIGNIIENNFYGIGLYWSSNNIFKNNSLVDNRYHFEVRGLYISDYLNDVDASNSVDGKPIYYWINTHDATIPGDAGCVVLVNCTNVTIENLELAKNGESILLAFTNNATITHNTLIDNLFGVELYHSWNNSIYENSFINNGLYVFYSYQNYVWNNTVNDKPLVYLEGISNCTISDAGQVILVRCENIKVERVNISKTDIGIQLFETNNSTIKSNIITANNVHGISISYSLYNSISENSIINNIESNSEGVVIRHSSNNSIEGNMIMNNEFGIYLWNSSSNHLYRNSITNNLDGIWLRYSSNNRFYHNNFINNTRHVWTSEAHYNIWDDGYPSGGNFWSGYIAFDYYSGPYQNETGGDGISDTEYLISESNVDRYPLLAPFGGLTITGQNVTSYPSSDVCLIFENVTSEGFTTFNVTSVGPDPPTDFKLAGNYYDIVTTANFSGTIRIRIIYDDSNMSEEDENSLRLMQWDDALQQWMDITTFLDTENNVIYGETSHLSIFVIVIPLYVPPTTYTLTITATVGGKTNPALGIYTYNAGSMVSVTAIPSSSYVFDHWELNGINIGSTNPYTVSMNDNYILIAFFTLAPTPLTVSISPTSASILIGQSVTFTSTVSGGTTPYSYQWYLNDNPVSGATSNTLAFTPTTSGIYCVYLNVTDSKGNTARSETARIIVATVLVGGYSIPIKVHTKAEPLMPCIALIAVLTTIFFEAKRKMKRKH